MGLGEKLRDFISPSQEGEEIEEEQIETESASIYETAQDESASKLSSAATIVLFEPRNFDEAQEIGKHIKKHKACCINLHKMPLEYRQRLIDFLSGVVFGVDGSIKKIGDDVILCSPKNLPVSGNISLKAVSE